MTHIKIEASHTDDERWIGAGGNAFAVHIAALVYCDRQLNNGRISKAMAQRVSLAVEPFDAAVAVGVLVERGFWTEVEGGYQIEDFLEHAFPAEQIKRTRERWKADKDRRRQHDNGDHSLCKDPKFCPALRFGSTVESRVDSSAEADTDAHAYTKPNSTKPNPTGGKGLGFGAGAGSAGATPPRHPGGEKCPHGVLNGIRAGQCPNDECVTAFENLNNCARGKCFLHVDPEDVPCETGACWLRDEMADLREEEAS